MLYKSEPGLGKTHCAIGLGLAACRQDRRVRFYTETTLINELPQAHDEHRLASDLHHSARSALAIAAEVPTVKLQEGVEGWSEELDQHLPMVSGNPERFAADLVRLASDAGLREEIGKHGALVVKEVDVGRVVERLGSLYRSVMSSRSVS